MPSVVVGLGMLVAFSDGGPAQRHRWIVIAARGARRRVRLLHGVLRAWTAPTATCLHAGAAASLGAAPGSVLLRARLPAR
ncbi:hypothetical protein ACU686_22880 [Yinghuangia aomiensis]